MPQRNSSHSSLISSPMDAGTRKRERGALSAQENRNKRPKVQYSPSRWPSSTPESEIEEIYMPTVLAAANFPLDVTEKEVKNFFKGRLGGGVEAVMLQKDIDDEQNIIAVGSLISFFSPQNATEGLKCNGKMLRGASIYVARQGNNRKIVCVSGFTGKGKKNMKRKLKAALKPRAEVLNIFLPTKSGGCLGFGYVYLIFKGKEEKELYDPMTIGDDKVDVRDSTMRKSYLPVLLGKKNVSNTEKTRLKKVLLPIPDGLHDLSANTFSWEVKRPKIIPKIVKQDKNDCWAVALTSHYNSMLKLLRKNRPVMRRDQLIKGVDPAYVVSGNGIDRLKHAAPFMKSFGCDMDVYNRPRGDDVEKFEAFEKLIERLLEKGPIMVTVECSHGFLSFNKKEVYLPTDVDIYQRTFEKFPMHCLLLTGYSREDGKQYWRLQDSQGKKWGDRGFIRIERHKCLIKSVVKLNIGDQDG